VKRRAPAPGKRRGSKLLQRCERCKEVSVIEKYLTDSQWACKLVQPGRAAGSGRPPGPLARHFHVVARHG
jgi:hypothetical protein